MSKLCRSLCLMLLIFSACNGRTYSSAAESPEELMSNWVGTWNIELSLKKSALVPEAVTLKGKETNKWILNKNFLQSAQNFDDGAYKKMGLMRYEPNEGVFLFWDFDSKGGFPMGVTYGKWDQSKKEIALTGEYLGAKGEGVVRLIDHDTVEVVFKVEAENGTVLLDFEVSTTRSN